MTHQRKLKPWVVPVAIFATIALIFLFFRVVDYGESDYAPPRSPSYGDGVAPVTPTVASEKVCGILDGVYIDSREEQRSLDERVYKYYGQLVNENGILAGFAEDLHDEQADISFLNELLAEDVAKECSAL